MPQRLFTRDEAEGMLPQIAPLLWQAQRLKREHDDAQQKVAELQAKGRGNGHALDSDIGAANSTMQKTATEINAIVDRVNGLGIEVKDLDIGLVDFHAEMEGREVYLCWKLGEERVSWWHELHTGYAGRQPLE